MNRFINQSGFGTVMAIIMVAVLSAVIIVLGPMMDQTARANKQTKDEIDAQFAAEAGIQYALVVVDKDPNAVKTLNKQKGKLENGAEWELFVTGPDSDNLYKIRSHGTVGTVKKLARDMSVKIKLNNGGPLYDYAAYSGNKLTVENGSKVYEAAGQLGKMGALGNIYVNSNVIGFAGIDGTNQERLIGKWAQNVNIGPGHPQPEWYKVKTEDQIGKIAFDNEINKKIGSKWIYEQSQNGEIIGATIGSKSYQGDKVLQSNGDLSIEQLATIQAENLILYVDGTVTLQSGATINAKSVKIYAKKEVVLNADSIINAKSIEIFTESKFTSTSGKINMRNVSDLLDTDLKIYAHEVSLNNDSEFNAQLIEVKVDGDENTQNFGTQGTSGPMLNKDLLDGIVRIYGRGSADFSNIPIIGCSAIVEFENDIAINNDLNAKYGIFISGDTLLIGGGKTEMAGAYAVREELKMTGIPCAINAMGKKNDVLKKLGSALPLIIGHGYTIEDGSWQLPNDEKTNPK